MAKEWFFVYKIAVPVSIGSLNEDSYPIFLEEFKKAGVERVFVCGLNPPTQTNFEFFSDSEKGACYIDKLKKEGFEVGVWMGSIGHGSTLSYEFGEVRLTHNFDLITDSNGDTKNGVFCPLSEKFLTHFEKVVTLVGKLSPDIIMFDDDFRLNFRGSLYTACCCDKHLKMFSEKIGKFIPREEIAAFIFSRENQNNRKLWMEVQSESMLNFARRMRKALDKVNPKIRMGFCTTPDTWDYSGTDVMELSRAFAGNTEPFVRTFGAPYHNNSLRVTSQIENTRMQASWCRKEGIEVFAEGDVYPRPRYTDKCGSANLELFDLALMASGNLDGVLKYMFDYTRPVNYEMGYVARHARNNPLREGIRRFFKDKKCVGVSIFEEMHQVAAFDISKMAPDFFCHGNFEKMSFTSGGRFFAENGIPTVFEGGDYPIVAFGENARYIKKEDMKNGVIVDIQGALRLNERGFDTGLISYEGRGFEGEYYPETKDTITGLEKVSTCKVECRKEAKVLTKFMPDDTPGSYIYSGEDGIKYYVLCYNALSSLWGFSSGDNVNYSKNYYRQAQLYKVIEELCGKNIPACCLKNPYLYTIQAKSKDEKELSVALFNMNTDEIIDSEILLDGEYSKVEAIGVSASLEGNKVIIDGLPGYKAAVINLIK